MTITKLCPLAYRFSEKNETSYRPTNEDCLMRITSTPNFCRACIEGLWYALLRRVTLIDGLVPSCRGPAAVFDRYAISKQQRVLDLSLVPLAHLRDTPIDVKEGYAITWVKNGVEVPAFENQTRLIDDGDAVGSYVVQVKYWTEEVRVDPDRLLESVAAVTVTTRCL